MVCEKSADESIRMINSNGTCSLYRELKVLEGGCSVLEIPCNATGHNPRYCEYIDDMLLQAYLEKKAELAGVMNHIVMDIQRRHDK